MAKKKTITTDPAESTPVLDSPTVEQIEVGIASQDEDTAVILEADDDEMIVGDETPPVPSKPQPLTESERLKVIGIIENHTAAERHDATRITSILTNDELRQIYELRNNDDPTPMIISILTDAKVRHSINIQAAASEKLKAAQKTS